MDGFLSEINADVFYAWVMDHKVEGRDYSVQEDTQLGIRTICLDNDYAHAEVRFNPMNIIELQADDKTTGRTEFYLHFQLSNLNHATSLYNEFTDALAKLNEKKTLKVLLSCTGGLTTSLFAGLLNEAAKAIGLDWQFNATPYSSLLHEGDDYNVILLAPQISYQHDKVKSGLRHKLVLDIPPQVFASYNVAEMLRYVQAEIEKDALRKRAPVDMDIRRDFSNPYKTLVISIIRHTDMVRLGYRIYDKDEMIENNETIKTAIDMQDIDDIISVALAGYPDIDIIGITTPGIINDGYVDNVNDALNHVQMKDMFVAKYHKPVVVSNDVNAIAVGLYATQELYENLTFYFQPRYNIIAGAGNIINGRLHTGWKNLSGEMLFMPGWEDTPDMRASMATTEGNIALVANNLRGVICNIAPDVIYVYCDLIPDIEELKAEVQKYIPEEYVPTLIKDIHLKDYMLVGQMILCAGEALD